MSKESKKNTEDTKESTTPARAQVIEEYRKDIADEICAELSDGVSLRTVLKNRNNSPSAKTWFRWMRENDELRKSYQLAKEEAADAMAEDILVISDDSTNDWMDREYGKGNVVRVTDPEALQRSKLRVDTRKFLMAKMKPKRYGDKLDITSDNKQLPTPIFGGLSTKGKNK